MKDQVKEQIQILLQEFTEYMENEMPGYDLRFDRFIKWLMTQ